MQTKQITCVFYRKGDISTLNGNSLKLVDKFTYLGSCISSTESEIILSLSKFRNSIDKLSTVWQSTISDKIKCDFFQIVVSILLYGWTTGTLTKYIEKKLDRSCTRMLRAVLNKPWKQHLTKQQLYSHLLPISKSIRVRRTRRAGHC